MNGNLIFKAVEQDYAEVETASAFTLTIAAFSAVNTHIREYTIPSFLIGIQAFQFLKVKGKVSLIW